MVTVSNGKMLLLPCFSNKLTYSGFSENPVDDPDEEDDRGHWGSKAEFILSCVGFSVRPFFNYKFFIGDFAPYRFNSYQVLNQRDMKPLRGA